MSTQQNISDTKNKDVWQKVLSNGEEVKEEFSLGNSFTKFWGIFWIVILTLPLYTIPFAILAGFYFFFYLKKANIYAYTNKRVLIHRGWLSTHLISVDYNKITDVFVSESFLQKVFTKSGTIAINTAGTGGEEIVLKNVANPYKLKKLLDELKDSQ